MLKKTSLFVSVAGRHGWRRIFDTSKSLQIPFLIQGEEYFIRAGLYVTASPDFLRLTDTDGDGVADKRESHPYRLDTESQWSFVRRTFFRTDGWMYLTDAKAWI